MATEPDENEDMSANAAPTRKTRSRAPQGVAQHGRLGSAGGGPLGIIKWAAIVIVTVLVGLTATAAMAIVQIYSSLTFDSNNVIAAPDDSNSLTIQNLDGGFNFLLAGTDTRSGQTGTYTAEDETGVGNSDVIMLLHVSADHKSATVVSFPRDLMVSIPSCPKNDGSGTSYSAMSKQQINSTLSYGGVYCTVLTVEKLTGLTIPYYALVDFNGVIEMSNAVGGVTVCSTDAVNDSDSGLVLSAGENTLQGAQALAFLRTRHSFGDGSDLARISAQQVFLSSLMRKMTSAGTLTNPVTLYALASAAAENLKLSQSLASVSTMVSMANALSHVDLNNMVFVQAPTTADPDNANRVVLATETSTKLFTALAQDESVTLATDSTGRGAVTSSSSAAASATTEADGTESATTEASSSAAASASSSSSSVALPSTVTGQTAATSTCAKVNE